MSCTAPGACTAAGTHWRLQPVPAPAGAVLTELFGVSCPAPAACTAAGTSAGLSDIGVTLAMSTGA